MNMIRSLKKRLARLDRAIGEPAKVRAFHEEVDRLSEWPDEVMEYLWNPVEGKEYPDWVINYQPPWIDWEWLQGLAEKHGVELGS